MPSQELICSIMSQVTTTQEMRRSHTSPTCVHTSPIPVDTPTNPFSPTHMEPSLLQVGTEFHAHTMAEDKPPTLYPRAESSRIPSHYLLKDKGKKKRKYLHTPHHVNQYSQNNQEEMETTNQEIHLSVHQDHHLCCHQDLSVQGSQS